MPKFPKELQAKKNQMKALRSQGNAPAAPNQLGGNQLTAKCDEK